jgi:hypothetical protein
LAVIWDTNPTSAAGALKQPRFLRELLLGQGKWASTDGCRACAADATATTRASLGRARRRSRPARRTEEAVWGGDMGHPRMSQRTQRKFMAQSPAAGRCGLCSGPFGLQPGGCTIPVFPLKSCKHDPPVQLSGFVLRQIRPGGEYAAPLSEMLEGPMTVHGSVRSGLLRSASTTFVTASRLYLRSERVGTCRSPRNGFIPG